MSHATKSHAGLDDFVARCDFVASAGVDGPLRGLNSYYRRTECSSYSLLEGADDLDFGFLVFAADELWAVFKKRVVDVDGVVL